MIVAVDYGMGNHRSVQKSFERLGSSLVVTSDKNEIAGASKIILPGVGHFGKGMQKLKELNLTSVLNQKALEEKTPVLGICLGMQLMTTHSEEGNVDGLNWIPAHTKKFELNSPYKVPHIGWNSASFIKVNPLYDQSSSDNSFYFVHSYFVTTESEEHTLAKTKYGNEFCSAIMKDNIFGVQFHPEKSHDDGFKLLEKFIQL